MSDFKVLFPHIPFFGGLSSSANNALNTVTGAFREYYEADSESTSENFTFYSSSAPLLNDNFNPDYLCLVGINDLIDRSVSNLTWSLTTTPSEQVTGSITSGDLIDDYFYYSDLNFAAASAISQYSLDFNWSTSETFKLSKTFLGKAFDFGRNPVYKSNVYYKTSGSIKPFYSGTLTFEAVAKDTVINFLKYIGKHSDKMTFIFKDSSNIVFSDKKFLYVAIKNHQVTWNNDHEAEVIIDFEEIH